MKSENPNQKFKHPLAALAGAPVTLLAAMLTLAGCGKKEEGGGMGGFPVSAVVAPVEQRVLAEKIFLVGSLEAMEEVELVSEVDARVTELRFEEGQPVRKGELLMRLDDRKLAAAVAEMQARHDLARTNLERSSTLLKRETIAQQDYDQAKAEFDTSAALLELARERLEDATIRAPFAGVMTERLVSPGQYMSRGEALASIVQVDPLEVAFNVPERYISQLVNGQRIDITVEAYPGASFAARVVFISPRVDRDTRTVLVKAELGNADGRLKPGMFGSLELIFTARDAALVIPEAAISYSGDQASVVVMNAEGKAEFRPVSVGLRIAGAAEVTAGLDKGERVVVEGYQKMRPGSTILISPESERFGLRSDGSTTTTEG